MTQILEQELWQYLDQHRGTIPSGDYLFGWIESGKDFRDRRARLQTWLATAGAGHTRGEGEFLSTREIASFMARIGASGKPGSIVDPVCGSGLLLGLVAEFSEAAVVHGIER